jgi:hypothetical protein
MSNPEGIIGTYLNKDDAVCRALRFLLMSEVTRHTRENIKIQTGQFGGICARIDEAMGLYEELGGIASDE